MAEKEIPAGADLTKLPTIGTYKQNTELAEAFQKAMEESPHVLVIQEKPRWIPCSERLPEDDENVLVYILTSHMNFISLAHIHKGVFRSAWNHEKITNVVITHWMPLPEIPELSEKE